MTQRDIVSRHLYSCVWYIFYIDGTGVLVDGIHKDIHIYVQLPYLDEDDETNGIAEFIGWNTFLSVNETQNPPYLYCNLSIPSPHGKWNDSKFDRASSGLVLFPIFRRCRFTTSRCRGSWYSPTLGISWVQHQKGHLRFIIFVPPWLVLFLRKHHQEAFSCVRKSLHMQIVFTNFHPRMACLDFKGSCNICQLMFPSYFDRMDL